MIISDFLQTLKSSGEGSFEDLVGELLEALTGLRFYAARSGDQGGRDGRASGPAGGYIVFECKRYSGDTALKDRDLMGGLAQAHISLPELDVWIIAASRDVTDQNLAGLQAFGKEHGIDIVPLESLPNSRGNLDFLVGAFPIVVERFANPGEFAAIKTAIEEAANSAESQAQLAELRKKFRQPSAGWPSWREGSHEEWSRIVSQETASRSRFGQPLDVSSGGGIPRIDAEAALDAWWSNNLSTLFAMTGGEGDGKSWSVAQWLTNQVQKTHGDFPPIVFIPSRDAGSAKTLEDLVLENVQRLFPTGDWRSKLYRWLEYRDADANEPVAVVVLDGLNERHSSDYWRTVIETSFDKPWVGGIRLICTARSQYWDEFFAKRPSIAATRFKLQSFNDAELQLALNGRGLKVSDFPEELRPLLRRPRYFDLAATYRDQIAESGDFTLARLYFEDWRDRCDRSNRHMSENGFNDFLRQIAEKYRDGVQQLAKSEIEGFIGFDADSRDVFRDLATGGVLEQQGLRWKVSEARLPMALGLLLGDELSTAPEDADLNERIAKWLEPHTGSDIEALIIEYAVLTSVAQGATPQNIANLLQVWIDTQNPRSPAGSPIERRLIAYLPQCLDAYVELAKSVWGSAKDHPWAQEVLIRGFSFWVQNSQPVMQRIMPVLEEWLAMVPIDGPPMFRRMPNVGAAPDRDTRVQTLWPDAQASRDYELCGYRVRLIDDDGWLRLSHVAFVIISFIEDRRPLVPAFARYSVAKAIHESADGQKELRWAIRSSKFDLEPLFQPHIQSLLSDNSRPAQWVCSRLLRMIGTEAAWQALSSLDEDALYPEPDFEAERRKNPVESIFRCTIKDLEEYVSQENFKSRSFVDSAEDFAADTDLNLPPEVRKRLRPLLEQLEANPVWQGQWKSGEDHWLEKAEVVLSRVDPEAIANLIRRIVKGAPARSVEALYSLAFRLKDYDLLLDSDARRVLETVRQSNPELQGTADTKGTHCEFFLFSRALPLWDGSDQLRRLLARPAEALDWIDFENSYRGPVDGNLPQSNTPKDWFRTLYYLSVLGEDKLNDDDLRSAYDTGDSLVRGSLYRYVLFCNVSKERFAPFTSDWSWNTEMHHMEQTYGSLLLMKLAQEDQSQVPWKRLDPTFRATTLLKNGGSDADWAEYSAWFTKMIAALQVPLPNDDVPAYEITYCVQETGRPGRVSLAPEPSRSVRFVAPESHWGGRSAETPFAGLIEEPEIVRERTKVQNQRLRDLDATAAQLGNYWMQRCFPRDAIQAMLDHAPAIIDGSLRSLTTQPTPKIPLTAVSYYSALVEVLFLKSDRIGDAVAVFRILRSLGYGVRIIDADTGLRQLDIDAFGAPETAETRSLWDEELAACSSDLDLLELAIKVRRSPGGDSEKWFDEVITQGLQSKSAYEQARAVSLRGFLEAEPNAEWLTETTKEDDSWYRTVLRTSQRRAKSERDARHWLKKFCEPASPDEAWAAFRLFLTIADRRCWLWCHKELAILGEDDPRRSFFESNRDEVRKACKENEEKLPKSFLGCEVADQMSPWRHEQ
jgi:hypothetical protein